MSENNDKAPSSVKRSKELLGVSGEVHKSLLIGKKDEGSKLPPKITRMPQCALLDRVSMFLPQLAQANEKLQKDIEEAGPGQYDIEVVEEGKPHVEMALSLGVMDSEESEDTDRESEEDGKGANKKARIVELPVDDTIASSSSATQSD